MYDTAVNGWSIAKATPYARDPLVELAAACRTEGLRFGLYYSILDWHEPSQKGAGKAAYVAAMKRQLGEIAARFDPDVLWFDGEWEDWWTAEDGRDLAAYVRSIAPRAVVNNRVGKRGGTDGDYETPEQEIPRAGYARPWETCMTTNNSWGFHKADPAWKSSREITRLLAEVVGKGGNFLLNVGPTAEGVIPGECASRLEEVGRWLAANGEAVYGTRGFWADRWGAITRKGRRLYAILTERPSGPVRLPLVTPVKRARLLDGREVKVDGAGLVLPALPDALAWVVALDFDEEPVREKTRAERTADGEPIPAGADGAIELWAADAKCHGSTIRVEHVHPRGNAGFWTANDDFIEWFVDATGEYDVDLTYAVAPGAGGDFVVRVGDASVAGSVSSTGGWGAFKTVTLGRVALAGRASVSVRPVKFTHALMNLACVKLVSRKP
jgi:alpha-L-fucosidase